ncbi:hypothetical protein SAMN05421751_103274 [Jhaorihella thermophila]|uniref:Uncharacterized protein n=1 Tax=Jhaorihella thermophila TaxID=488547 RepID=A0A1H5U8E6_9RHOB|nr:hypothetical protein SAMN05421751_103274 [Jhaorihella thermophila]
MLARITAANKGAEATRAVLDELLAANPDSARLRN